SGREFVDRYGDGSDAVLMENLKERLVQPQRWGSDSTAVTTPPVMLRRFKADILEGLPAKEERPWQETMPAEQARAYDAIVASMQNANLHPSKRSSNFAGSVFTRIYAFRLILRICSSSLMRALDFGHSSAFSEWPMT